MLIFLWADGAPFENIMMNNMNADFPPQVNPTFPISLLQNSSLASSLGIVNSTLMEGVTDVGTKKQRKSLVPEKPDIQSMQS